MSHPRVLQIPSRTLGGFYRLLPGPRAWGSQLPNRSKCLLYQVPYDRPEQTQGTITGNKKSSTRTTSQVQPMRSAARQGRSHELHPGDLIAAFSGQNAKAAWHWLQVNGLSLKAGNNLFPACGDTGLLSLMAPDIRALLPLYSADSANIRDTTLLPHRAASARMRIGFPSYFTGQDALNAV